MVILKPVVSYSIGKKLPSELELEVERGKSARPATKPPRPQPPPAPAAPRPPSAPSAPVPPPAPKPPAIGRREARCDECLHPATCTWLKKCLLNP